MVVGSSRHQLIGLLLLAAAVLPARLVAAPPQVQLRFTADAHDQRYTGRVFLVLRKGTRGQPVQHSNAFFGRDPFFGQDVRDWRPNEWLSIDASKCLGYPTGLTNLPAGKYRIQALLTLNHDTWDVINAPGNAVSKAVTFEHNSEEPPIVKLTIDRRLPLPPLVDTPTKKYTRIRSRLLSKFHGRDIKMHAAVSLPPEYEEEPDRSFPAVYVISGFGGTIFDCDMMIQMYRGFVESALFECAVVYIDADCATGHHVFADSANNGPCGTALVKELIPHLEKRFRLIAEPHARFVTGISSGGWSSLWLQVAYPEFFGGVWSLSPDPVDFTAFMRWNIYDPQENVLRQPDGEPWEIMRWGLFGRPITLDDFIKREVVRGRGGQFYSFDAVFSPRDEDGRPRFLWDRKTGSIDPEVAKAWKKYDIRRIVEENWATLGPKLAGKLYLYCGDRDEFYLERAFFKLRDALERLGSDAFVEVVAGGGHMLSPMYGIQAAEQMRARFERTSDDETPPIREPAAIPG